jgi:hypothetical protein
MPPVSHNPSTRPPGGSQEPVEGSPAARVGAGDPDLGSDAATISQLRTSLIRALRASPQSVEPLCDALELLEGLQQRLETKRNPDAGEQAATASANRAQRRNSQAQEYIIQRTAEGEFLTERRPTGSQPFRCPKDAYLAAAKVLAGAEESLHFDELLDRLNAAMEQRQADYRLRVCLRFWGQPGLVQRFRTRYHAAEAGTFVRAAEAAWEELSAASIS